MNIVEVTSKKYLVDVDLLTFRNIILAE